ncbi:MAG: hypothetical protein ACTSYI_11545 [Promethearchaeota archaeon]
MKTTKQVFIFLLFSGLLLSSTLALGIAQEEGSILTEEDPDIDTDPEEVDDAVKKAGERVVTVDVTDDTAQIKSVLKTGNQKDDFTIDVDAITDLKIKMLYKSHTELSNVNLEFQLTLYSIVEYNDTNGDGVYNTDDDTAVQEVALDSFQPFMYENLSAHILTLNTTDGVFLVRIFAVEGYAEINGTIVSPAEIKIDFEFHNFPFLEDESLLTLAIKFQTNAGWNWQNNTKGEDDGLAEDETAVELEGKDAKGYFAWADYAMADGVEVAVLGSPLKDNPNDKNMFLNYPHATHIVHDPKIGVEDTSFSIPGYSSLAFFALVGIAGLIVGMKRRKV